MSDPTPAAVAFPEQRKFPLKSFRDQVNERLATLEDRSALLAVSVDGKRATVALMVDGGGGWTFVGWMEHDVEAHMSAGGVEVRKSW